MTYAWDIQALPDLIEDLAGPRAMVRTFEGRRIPLSITEHPHHRIPLESLKGLLGDAARLTGDPFLGIRLGNATRNRFHTYGRYVNSAPTLERAIRRGCTTIHLYKDGSCNFMRPDGPYMVWCLSDLQHKSLRVRAYSDHVLMSALRMIRSYLGQNWTPPWLEVVYPRGPDASVVEEMYGCPIVFEAPTRSIPLTRAELSTPLPTQNWPGSPVVLRDVIADFQVRRRGAHLDSLGATIALRLLDGDTDIDGCARLLRCSTRSIQRRLAEQGVTYRQLVEEARLQRAASLLRETSQTVIEIALGLGYTEGSNFSRAFKRWSGASPQQFRATKEPETGHRLTLTAQR
jgi:AraC-like DNA-binding protein